MTIRTNESFASNAIFAAAMRAGYENAVVHTAGRMN